MIRGRHLLMAHKMNILNFEYSSRMKIFKMNPEILAVILNKTVSDDV